MENRLLVIGAGGHATSVANVAHAAGYFVEAFVDDKGAGQELLGKPLVTQEKCFSEYSTGTYAIAIGDNAIRESVYIEFKSNISAINFPFIVHPSAVLSLNSQLGEGTVVMPNVIVGPNSTVGKFCILNTNSSIDHDCVLSDFTSIAPGVTTGGHVKLGKSSAISIGAVVKHGITIDDDVIVGASSYVDKDIGEASVYYGVPAKKIRSRKKGDPYLDD